MNEPVDDLVPPYSAAAAASSQGSTAPAPRRDGRAVAAAWVLTLALSGLPMIILGEVTGTPPATLSGWVLVGAIPLLGLAGSGHPADGFGTTCW